MKWREAVMMTVVEFLIAGGIICGVVALVSIDNQYIGIVTLAVVVFAVLVVLNKGID
jgi:hypothetical protein